MIFSKRWWLSQYLPQARLPQSPAHFRLKDEDGQQRVLQESFPLGIPPQFTRYAMYQTFYPQLSSHFSLGLTHPQNFQYHTPLPSSSSLSQFTSPAVTSMSSLFSQAPQGKLTSACDPATLMLNGITGGINNASFYANNNANGSNERILNLSSSVTNESLQYSTMNSGAPLFLPSLWNKSLTNIGNDSSSVRRHPIDSTSNHLNFIRSDPNIDLLNTNK